MIHHSVIRTLYDGADAPRFKALLADCANLMPGMSRFQVSIRTQELKANADVVLMCRCRLRRRP